MYPPYEGSATLLDHFNGDRCRRVRPEGLLSVGSSCLRPSESVLLEPEIDRLGDDQSVTSANEALTELEERYGVSTPIQDRVQELTKQDDRGLEVLHTPDESMTVDELATDGDC
ncbi:hypothetical protein QNM96_22010 [Halostagnicola sp. A-GB9-2]|nr:hypothetical protein [Halostagnicola sp. A-GB9-2]MDJ1434693.1 hypothetical protein [Halostagnicola sp. A-GB9-2]